MDTYPNWVSSGINIEDNIGKVLYGDSKALSGYLIQETVILEK